VTSFRAVPVRAVLGLLGWFNPEMILGGVNMDLISRDEEVKRALASDRLRFQCYKNIFSLPLILHTSKLTFEY
jgi:hypothetical protein